MEYSGTPFFMPSGFVTSHHSITRDIQLNGYDQILGERNLNDGRCYSWFNPTKYTYDTFNNRDKNTRYDATFQKVWYATKTVEGGEINYTIDGVDEHFNWSLTEVGDTAMYYPGYYMSAAEIRAKMSMNFYFKRQPKYCRKITALFALKYLTLSLQSAQYLGGKHCAD